MGCLQRDTTALRLFLYKIPIPVNRNCVAVSTAEYGPISIRKSKIMNRNIKAKFEPFYCRERMIIPALHKEWITRPRVFFLENKSWKPGKKGHRKMQWMSVKSDVAWRRWIGKKWKIWGRQISALMDF